MKFGKFAFKGIAGAIVVWVRLVMQFGDVFSFVSSQGCTCSAAAGEKGSLALRTQFYGVAGSSHAVFFASVSC